MGTKLQMLLHSKPNVLSYWRSTINQTKPEFYSHGKLALPRFIGLTNLLNKVFNEQVSSEYNVLNITIP